ncbi:MAG: hypothetical protein HYW07_24195 [Candidatus Latescibacteria bacterium]|nr:hypothetical protein [Candidatus Latescibacterota bacterium]
MSSETVDRSYGPYFYALSHPERLAAIRFIEEMTHRYPEIGAEATAGPGNEETVYIYAPLPVDDDAYIEFHQTMARVSVKVLLDTGVSMVLMHRLE